MAYTWATVRSDIRLLSQDTDSALPGLTDAQLLLLANHRYQLWVLKYERTLIGTAATALSMPITPTIQSKNIVANILSVTGAAITTADGKVLPIKKFYKVLERAQYEFGVPDEVGILVAARSESQTDLKVCVAPVPEAPTNIFILYIAYPADISLDGDSFKVNHGHQRILTHLIAADAAFLLGRGAEFVAGILEPIKDSLPNGFNDWTVPAGSPSGAGGGGGGGDGGGGGGDGGEGGIRGG